MSRWKLTFRLDDVIVARTATVALGDLIEPSPDAVTCFEEFDSASLATPAWTAAAHRVEAYYSERPDPGAIETLLTSLLKIDRLAIQLVEVPDLNWVAISQAALPPVQAGRFTVHGAHDRGRVGRGPWRLEIDAGEAFGTAHHATTQGCLEALDRVVARSSPRRVLDVGCGSAVLAIAAARRWRHAHVMATDIDPVAIDVARANIRLNGLAGHVTTRIQPGVPAGRFDLILANILAGPLVMLAGAVARAANPGARVVLSGLLVPQAPTVLAAYVARGFALLRHSRIAGWSTLTLVNRGVRRAWPKPAA